MAEHGAPEAQPELRERYRRIDRIDRKIARLMQALVVFALLLLALAGAGPYL